jgi:hypothetical protein
MVIDMTDREIKGLRQIIGYCGEINTAVTVGNTAAGNKKAAPCGAAFSVYDIAIGYSVI